MTNDYESKVNKASKWSLDPETCHLGQRLYKSVTNYAPT